MLHTETDKVPDTLHGEVLEVMYEHIYLEQLMQINASSGEKIKRRFSLDWSVFGTIAW